MSDVHYETIKPILTVSHVGGDPKAPVFDCERCGKTVRSGFINLEVEIAETLAGGELTPVLGVMFLPEIIVSGELKVLLEQSGAEPEHFVQVSGLPETYGLYYQVLAPQPLRVAKSSILEGTVCDSCGGEAQVDLKNLKLVKPERHWPIWTCLLENRWTWVVRSDVAAQIHEKFGRCFRQERVSFADPG